MTDHTPPPTDQEIEDAFRRAVRWIVPLPPKAEPKAEPDPQTNPQEGAPRMADWFQILIPTTPPRYYVLDMDDPAKSLRSLAPEALLSSLAHALCGLRRYGGHTRRPYTVGAHCAALALYRVRVAFDRAKGDPSGVILAPADAVEALCALLHDAAEGLGLGDVVGPVKRLVGGPEMDNYEDAVVAACLAAVCPHMDHTHNPEQADTIRAELLRAMVRVKRWDARILLDEFAVVVRHAARPWDSVLGVFPLGLPRGPFAALAELGEPAAELLFVGLGLALARCANAPHRAARTGHPVSDFEDVFFHVLERSLLEARVTLAHTTRADEGLALVLARALIADPASRPDVQPCRIGPAEYFRLAHPRAAETWARDVEQIFAQTHHDAAKLAYRAERMGLRADLCYMYLKDDEPARVVVYSGKTSRTFEAHADESEYFEAPPRWRVMAEAPPTIREVTRDIINEALSVLPEPHRQFHEQARLLRLANDLGALAHGELRGASAEAVAEVLARYVPRVCALAPDRVQVGDHVLQGGDGEPWTLDKLTSPLAVAEAVLGYELVDELLGYLDP